MFYTPSRCTRYVLLFEGRTGSSYLTTLLDAHPRIRAMEEELRRLKPEGHQAQAEWIRRALRAPILSPIACRGFKTKLRDIADPAAFAELLQELQPRILFMQRRNRVKLAISEIRSRMLKERTDMYNAYRAEDRLPPVTIPLERFDRMLKERERLDAELKAFVDTLDLPRFDLFYEDILIDEEQFKRQVFSVLDVPYHDVQARTFKNTSDDLRAAVINFDSLKAAYAGTPYADMFDEVLVPADSADKVPGASNRSGSSPG